MATATQQQTPATLARGFGQLPCVQCGEASACITLDLEDGVTFRCHECEAEFTAEDVQGVIDRWAAVLAWVGTIPAMREE